MKWKKVISSILVASMTAALVAGCGGNASDEGGSADTSSADGKTVHFLTAWNEDEDITAVVKQLTDDYNATNPETPINLEIEVVAQSDMNQRLSVLAASNELPDMFVTGTQEYIESYVEQGILKNIDDVISEQGVTTISDEDRASILDLTKLDNMYVIPTNKNIEGIWYNKAIFEEQGLEVPTTMDEFMDVCAKLSDAGIQPLTVAGAEQWPITRLIGAYVTQLGGTDYLVKANDGEVSWSDDVFLQAYEWLQTMGAEGYFGEGMTTVDSDTQNSLFITGSAAMCYNGSWFTESLNSENNTIGQDVGFFAFPTVDGGEGVENTYTTSYGMYICVKDESYDDAMGAWLGYVMNHFGDKSMELHNWITPYAMSEEHETSFFTQILIDATEQQGAASVWPEYAMPTSVQDVEYQGAQMVALGQMTPEDYGQSIDDAWAQVQE